MTDRSVTDFHKIPANARSLAQRKLVCGVGINDAWYIVQPVTTDNQGTCPIYSTWKNMLKRCYDLKYQTTRPTYEGCSVCTEWLTFSTFAMWMTSQKWKGMALDKDILVPNNKVYSPEKCAFVTLEVNNLFCDSGASRGDWPVGVCWHKKAKKFMAYCRTDGNVKYLGLFTTPDAAHAAWRTFKIKVSHMAAVNQPDPRVRNALLNYEG